MTNLLIQKCTYLTEVCLFSYVFLKELRTSVENSFVERWWGHLLNWINLFSHSHVKLVPNDLGGANFSNLCSQKFLAKYIEVYVKVKRFCSNNKPWYRYVSYYCFKIQHIAYYFFCTYYLVSQHHVCRPLDPTLDIWSNFMKKLQKDLNNNSPHLGYRLHSK